MQNRMKYFPCLIVLFFFSCSDTLRSRAEAEAWLYDSENGLAEDKSIGNFLLRASYLPSAFIAKKDYPEFSWNELNDSLKQAYGNLYAFTFSIDPADGEDFEIAKWNVENEVDVNLRTHEFNFAMQEYFSLRIGEESFPPIHVILDNTYTIDKGKKWNVFFSIENIPKGAKEMSLLFEDMIFDTGLSSYNFLLTDIANFPALQY